MMLFVILLLLQVPPNNLPEFSFDPNKSREQITFLASDELLGRMTGEPGLDSAAAYIARHFEAFGLKPNPQTGTYYQPFTIYQSSATDVGSVRQAGSDLANRSVAVLSGGPTDNTYSAVHLPDLSDSTLALADVKGKIVVAPFPTEGPFQARFSASNRIRAQLASAGALGLVQWMSGDPTPPRLASFLRNSNNLSPASDFIHIIADAGGAFSSGDIHIQTPGITTGVMTTQNVVGIIEGTDPLLKNEYVLLMAHYDHIGARRTPVTTVDTIFNGARDNAMGVVAMLHAAEAFSKVPTKRSVIILPVSAEEIGLIGSRYYTENPIIPLKQTVYVSNIDGAGYNVTDAVTVIGLERTSASTHYKKAAAAFNLRIWDDPAGEQGLFNRSDNVNFARVGIPAPTFTAGFTAFDDEIMKYYHRPGDEADENFDFDYLHTYVSVFVHATRLIADAPERITWTSGDMYEPAFNRLFNQD
jgi:aminopeptidase YwaD